ncbi:MAG: hypothetical protein IJ834_01610 [Paludibacteraceae bacterium]|nr:hypothetical protein [Paludibacteraceae bacterium]
MALLNFCQQIDPNDAAVQQSLGYMYQGLRQDSLALSHYQRAYNAQPLAYWENYVTLLYRLNPNQQGAKIATQVLSDVISKDPDNIEALEALSSIYQTIGDTKKALLTQEKIEKAEGINQYNTSQKYQILVADQQYDKAIQTLQDYLLLNPTDMRTKTQIADTYMQMGKSQKALQLYLQEANDNPDNPYNLLSLAQFYRTQNNYNTHLVADSLVLLAMNSDEFSLPEKYRLEQQNKDLFLSRDTINNFKERLYNLYLQNYPLNDLAYSIFANYYIAENQPQKALPLLLTQISINPNNSQTYTQVFDILQQDTTTTDSLYTHIITTAHHALPNNMKWSYWMSRVYVMQEKNDSAILVIKNAIEHGKDENRYLPALWIMLGDIYSLQQQWDSTFHSYQEALKYDSKNTYVLNNYAYTLAIHGNDLNLAEKMSQQTIEQEPDNATFLDTYAWILYLKGQNILALFYIKRALENMSPNENNQEIIDHYNQIIKQ